MMIEGCPVAGFDMKFRWQEEWVELFNKQVELIQEDVARARAEDRVIVYLSCPISSRGGGNHRTNVEIARHTERRLVTDWGHRFWILNPAQYQMQSKEGTGLIQRHARTLGIGQEELDRRPEPTGGDYMRMWTRVLVEDGDEKKPRGRRFDAFYFLGPTDVRHFFSRGGAVTLTAGIEEYFARKFSMDPDFRHEYSTAGIDWGVSRRGEQTAARQSELKDRWEDARKSFFRFYAIRASVNFSLGSHDEWNIFRLLCRMRLADSESQGMEGGNPGDLLAGYFDGRQIDPGAAFVDVSPGYAV